MRISHRKKLTLFAALVACSAGLSTTNYAHAQSDPTGYWTTIDDDGKTPTSVVHIQKKNGKLYGRIVRLINPKDRDPRCKECSGKRRNQKIQGMQILWGLEKDGDEWTGGHVLDPNNGKEYRCNVMVAAGGKQLKVRSYIGIALLGRTQIWRRARAPR